MQITFTQFSKGKHFQEMMDKYESIKSTLGNPQGNVNDLLQGTMDKIQRVDVNSTLIELLKGKKENSSLFDTSISDLVKKYNSQKPIAPESIPKRNVLEGIGSASIGIDEDSVLSKYDKDGDGKVSSSDFGLDSWAASINETLKKYAGK